jgi:hypothetical protein
MGPLLWCRACWQADENLFSPIVFACLTLLFFVCTCMHRVISYVVEHTLAFLFLYKWLALKSRKFVITHLNWCHKKHLFPGLAIAIFFILFCMFCWETRDKLFRTLIGSILSLRAHSCRHFYPKMVFRK